MMTNSATRRNPYKKVDWKARVTVMLTFSFNTCLRYTTVFLFSDCGWLIAWLNVCESQRVSCGFVGAEGCGCLCVSAVEGGRVNVVYLGKNTHSWFCVHFLSETRFIYTAAGRKRNLVCGFTKIWNFWPGHLIRDTACSSSFQLPTTPTNLWYVWHLTF